MARWYHDIHVFSSRNFPAAFWGELVKLQAAEDLGYLEDGKLPVQEVEPLEWLSTERLEPLQETVFLPEVQHVEKDAFDVSEGVPHLSDAAESSSPPAERCGSTPEMMNLDNDGDGTNLEMDEENVSQHQYAEVQGIRNWNCTYDFCW